MFLHSDQLKTVVRDGALAPNGMPRFKDITDEELKALQHFIRKKALEATQPESN